jgi:hypothetical protein
MAGPYGSRILALATAASRAVGAVYEAVCEVVWQVKSSPEKSFAALHKIT